MCRNPAPFLVICLLMGVVLSACQEDEHEVMTCDGSWNVDIDNSEAPLLGEIDGPVEVTFFVDFQCPPSGNMALHILALLADLEQEGMASALKLHVRHFPSSLHNHARDAALAAAAAHRQGDAAFFRLFPHLFKNGVNLEDEDILLYVELAGLDVARWQSDVVDPKVEAVVDMDFDLAVEIGLDATPGVLICGTIVDPDPEAVVANLRYLVEAQF